MLRSNRDLFALASLLVPLAGCTTRMHGSEAGPPPKEPPRPAAERRAPEPKPEPTSADVGSEEVARPEGKQTILARHVLIQYIGAVRAEKSIVRTKEQALLLAKEVARRAHAGEDLGRLAVEYSDEPGASSRGGSLGRFPRGQMVKEFDDVAFRLAPGQISDVVETGFGYHVIQRIE
jgi:hypothetical protein